MRVTLPDSSSSPFTSRRDEDASVEFGVRECSPGAEATFYVRDNGVGFASERAPDLFREFTRLHGEREYHGTGIGLSTVRRVIERHGGRVWAEGSPGRGATFYFTLRSAAGVEAGGPFVEAARRLHPSDPPAPVPADPGRVA